MMKAGKEKLWGLKTVWKKHKLEDCPNCDGSGRLIEPASDEAAETIVCDVCSGRGLISRRQFSAHLGQPRVRARQQIAGEQSTLKFL
jgi:DnaJ-class molecular chaperone